MLVIDNNKKTYKLRVELEIGGSDPDKPDSGSFVVELPIPERDFVDEITELQRGGKMLEVYRRVILGVEGIGPANGESYPPDVQLDIVLKDYRLGNAALKAYRADIAKAASKN